MIKDIIKHALPMLLGGKHHVFPTLAELVFGPDGEPLVKDGKWNLPVPDGVVPDTRKINGHALDGDVELDAADVKARPDDWLPTVQEIHGAVWKAGDAVSFPQFLIINGWAFTDKNAWLSIPLGRPIAANGVDVTQLRTNRMFSGKTIIGTSAAEAPDLIKTAGYTVVPSLIRDAGVLTLSITTEASVFTANTPAFVCISALSLQFK